jgi:hypothetical protein
MKKLLLLSSLFLMLVSCVNGDIKTGVDKALKETSTSVLSPFVYKGEDYNVTRIGNLIFVKSTKSNSSEDNNELCKKLKSKYKGKNGINDVYVNAFGIITLDCSPADKEEKADK